MRAAAVGKAAAGVEAAFIEFFREKIVGFFLAAGLKPDAVVLAFLVVLPADCLAALTVISCGENLKSLIMTTCASPLAAAP